jgi:hypothetical protein
VCIVKFLHRTYTLNFLDESTSFLEFKWTSISNITDYKHGLEYGISNFVDQIWILGNSQFMKFVQTNRTTNNYTKEQS